MSYGVRVRIYDNWLPYPHTTTHIFMPHVLWFMSCGVRVRICDSQLECEEEDEGVDPHFCNSLSAWSVCVCVCVKERE